MSCVVNFGAVDEDSVVCALVSSEEPGSVGSGECLFHETS